jgi:transposase
VENLIMAKGTAYPADLRERAVALVFEQVNAGEYSSQWNAIRTVATKVGVSREALRRWVRQAEVDAGARPGASSAEAAEVKQLRREVAELRRANEILKAASAFFARELDPRLPRS